MAILSPATGDDLRQRTKSGNHFREMIASAISRKILARLLPGVWPGRVTAIFERSLNVEMEDDFLIHLGSDSLPLTPRSILLREEDFHHRLMPECFLGQPVTLENGSISLGQKRVILFHPQTRLYEPRLDLAAGLLPPSGVLNHLNATLRGIEKRRKEMGKPSFSPFRGYFLSRIFMIGQPRFDRLGGPGLLDGESDRSLKMKQVLWKRADGVLRAMSRRDWGEFREFARGLIGSGPGLTPSGDDFLAGFISSGAIRSRCSKDSRGRQEAFPTAAAIIREEAAGRTTSVSVAMLADAANGEVPEPVKHFLTSILQNGDERETGFWSGEIIRIGASSGEDLLNGLASGILFFQPWAAPAGQQEIWIISNLVEREDCCAAKLSRGSGGRKERQIPPQS